MKSLVVFNNKGGVGKTTLTCNFVSYLNIHLGRKVLLIDADPQCNATQMLLDDSILQELYLSSDKSHKTLFDYLAPLREGEAAIDCSIVPVPRRETEFGTDLVPGHPRMSLIEDRLSRAWGDFLGADRIPGFRTTNWLSQLFKSIEERYDLVVFDVGPSLGALNRTVLLSCDFVLTPFGSDIFSLLGIRNISEWMLEWGKDYQQAFDDLKSKSPEAVAKFPGVSDISKKHRFAGYSVQQYVARKFKSGKRPVKAYDAIMEEIPATVEEELTKFSDETRTLEQLKLGDIPFLYSLAPLAQSNKVPIHKLVDARAVRGAQVQQVSAFTKLMGSFSDRLLHNIGEGS